MKYYLLIATFLFVGCDSVIVKKTHITEINENGHCITVDTVVTKTWGAQWYKTETKTLITNGNDTLSFYMESKGGRYY